MQKHLHAVVCGSREQLSSCLDSDPVPGEGIKHQTHCTEFQAVLDLLHFGQPLLDHLLELFHAFFNLDLIQKNRCWILSLQSLRGTNLVFSGLRPVSCTFLIALSSSMETE